MLLNLIAANQSTVFEPAAVSDCIRAIEAGITTNEFDKLISDLLSAPLDAFLALVAE